MDLPPTNKRRRRGRISSEFSQLCCCCRCCRSAAVAFLFYFLILSILKGSSHSYCIQYYERVLSHNNSRIRHLQWRMSVGILYQRYQSTYTTFDSTDSYITTAPRLMLKPIKIFWALQPSQVCWRVPTCTRASVTFSQQDAWSSKANWWHWSWYCKYPTAMDKPDCWLNVSLFFVMKRMSGDRVSK